MVITQRIMNMVYHNATDNNKNNCKQKREGSQLEAKNAKTPEKCERNNFVKHTNLQVKSSNSKFLPSLAPQIRSFNKRYSQYEQVNYSQKYVQQEANSNSQVKALKLTITVHARGTEKTQFGFHFQDFNLKINFHLGLQTKIILFLKNLLYILLGMITENAQGL